MVVRSKAIGAKGAALPSPRDRFHLRVSRDVKDMLEQAAALATGGDVTAFVLGAAIERARHVIADLEVTRIDDESRRRFYDLLLKPPPPSKALRKLLSSNRFRVVS